MLENNTDPNQLSRLDLLRLAHSLHVSDADVMTRGELQAAIEKARRPEPRPAAQPVTWVSVARRLLASIVEQGLNLPDAAALIRGDTKLSTPPKAPPPVATVTLARIYAAQGHLSRAIRTLDQVLASEPDHERARALRAQLAEKRERDKASGSQSQAEAAESTASAAGSESAASAPASSLENGLASAANDLAEKLDADSRSDAVPSAGEVSAFDTERPTPSGVSALENVVRELPELLAEASALPDKGAPTEAAPSTEPAPPTEAAPLLEASSAAPPTDPAPAPTDISEGSPTPSAPGSTVPAAALAAPIPTPPPPLVSALLLIETNTPISYLYWELAASTTAPGQARWIWVVAHTPKAGGSSRLERRFPIYRTWGALRLEGVPRHSVLRAKLTDEGTLDAKPLVVAAAIRTQTLAAPDAIEVLFSPHAKANPLALANRASNLLENANAVYWDSVQDQL